MKFEREEERKFKQLEGDSFNVNRNSSGNKKAPI